MHPNLSLRRSTIIGHLLLALVVSSAVLACGKTEPTATGGAPTNAPTSAVALTKEQFVAQANAICQIPKAESDKIDQELRAKYPDPKAVPEAEFQVLMKDAVGKLLPLYKKQIVDLRALTPPPADAPMIAMGINQLDTHYKAVEANPGALGNPSGAQYQAGFDYGLTSCFAASTAFSSVATAIS